MPGRKRDFEAGQPRISAVSEDFKGGIARHGGTPEVPAVIRRRAEAGSRTAQPLQRITRNGQRSVSVRSRGKSRQGRSGPAQASLGSCRKAGGRGEEGSSLGLRSSSGRSISCNNTSALLAGQPRAAVTRFFSYLSYLTPNKTSIVSWSRR